MPPVEPLTIGLQEWAACCRCLGDARVLLTVRKGGIHEQGGGLFRPEHARFLLIPSFLHQEADRLKPSFRGEIAASLAQQPPPGRLHLSLWAEVVVVWKCHDLPAITALGPELPWSDAELEGRYTYKDKPWLWVLALKVMRLRQPVEIADDPSYAGCRSWITLREPVDVSDSVPVLNPGYFDMRLERINQIVAPGRSLSRETPISR